MNLCSKGLVVIVIVLFSSIGIISGYCEGISSCQMKNYQTESILKSWLKVIYPNGEELCSGSICIRWEWGGAIPILPVYFNIYCGEDFRTANNEWHTIVKDYKERDYLWDTTTVPDGQYLIKVDLLLDSNLDGHGDKLWITDTSDDFFTIENNNDPPYTPNNPNPEDGTINVNITTDLSWEGGDPDPGDTVTYNIFLGDNPESLVCVASAFSNEVYDPGELSYDTQYYWRIDAYDSNHDISEGPLWMFHTAKNRPPNVPSNPYPADGSTNICLTVNLNWTGGDPDNTSVVYDVYFGENSSPSIVATNLSITTYNVDDLKRKTTYYWKIDAYDGINVTEGAIWTFTTAVSLPPNTPAAPSGPTSGKPGMEYTYQSNTTDPEQNVLYYWFDWGDNTSSGWLGPYESGQMVSANHTWSEKDTYWIKVKAKNDPNGDGDLSDGSESLWSPYLPVTMPKGNSAEIIQPFIKTLRRYPHIFPILRYLLDL